MLLAAACGGSEAATPAPGTAGQGLEIANQAGCVACHGTDGLSGGVGPGWAGLAGSTVTLEDGSQVTADTAYLRRAIVDPDAEIVAGYTLRMPEVGLTTEEVAALIDYIEGLE